VHDVDPRSPERGQYAFVQSLVREVAYGTLSRPDRRNRHRSAQPPIVRSESSSTPAAQNATRAGK